MKIDILLLNRCSSHFIFLFKGVKTDVSLWTDVPYSIFKIRDANLTYTCAFGLLFFTLYVSWRENRRPLMNCWYSHHSTIPWCENRRLPLNCCSLHHARVPWCENRRLPVNYCSSDYIIASWCKRCFHMNCFPSHYTTLPRCENRRFHRKVLDVWLRK